MLTRHPHNNGHSFTYFEAWVSKPLWTLNKEPETCWFRRPKYTRVYIRATSRYVEKIDCKTYANDHRNRKDLQRKGPRFYAPWPEGKLKKLLHSKIHSRVVCKTRPSDNECQWPSRREEACQLTKIAHRITQQRNTQGSTPLIAPYFELRPPLNDAR